MRLLSIPIEAFSVSVSRGEIVAKSGGPSFFCKVCQQPWRAKENECLNTPQ